MTKAEKRRRQRAFFRIFSVVLFIAIIVIVLVLFTLIFCEVNKVSVSGTDLYTKEQIEKKMLTEKYDKYTVTSVIMSKIKKKECPEFIEKYEIKMKSLSELEIKLTEKDRTGVMDRGDSKYMYFDEDGVITEISKDYIDGSIVVSSSEISKDAKKVKIGENLPIPATDVRTLKTLIKELKRQEYNITNIKLNGESGIVIMYDAIEIRLGSRSNLDEKLKRLTYILPQLNGMAGILHLEDFNEDNTDIVFDKAQ